MARKNKRNRKHAKGVQGARTGFLDLPREIRDRVYDELLVFDRIEGYDHHVCPEIFGVNRQIREEAWESLTQRNYWVEFTMHDSGKILLQELSKKPFYPLLLTPFDAFALRLENKCGKGIPRVVTVTLSTEKLHPSHEDPSLTAVFAYTFRRYERLCQSLHNWIEISPIIEITANPGANLSQLKLESLFLQPLSVLRGFSTVTINHIRQEDLVKNLKNLLGKPISSWSVMFEIPLCYKDRATTMFAVKRYLEAATIFESGAWACESLIALAGMKEWDSDTVHGNYIFALRCDLTRNAARARNVFVDSRSHVHEHIALSDPESFLEHTIDVAAKTLIFPGITPFQRARGHYVLGVAFRNLARFKTLCGEPEQAREHFEEAACHLLFALDLEPDNALATRAFQEVYRNLDGVKKKIEIPYITVTIEQDPPFPPYAFSGDSRLLLVWEKKLRSISRLQRRPQGAGA